jgi:hypothetical protein
MRFDWGTVPAVAAAAVALAALVLSGFALAANRRSAAASELSAETAQRAVALATEARWSLTQRYLSMYHLTNLGRDTAYQVTVTGKVIRGVNPLTWGEVLGNEPVELYASMRVGQSDNIVVVTWHTKPDASDPERRWRCPLPEQRTPPSTERR